MTRSDPFGAKATLETAAGTVVYYQLSRLAEQGVSDPFRLPFSIRVLLENLLRHCDGSLVTEEDVLALARWAPRDLPDREIPFMPARVILQDFTGVPAVVDLAAMRSAVKRLGGDPRWINPLVPADLVIDHSVQVDFFGTELAFYLNVERARACGAEVIQHPFEHYAAQRNAALERVEADWIFFVDADERATPELAEEARAAIRDPRCVGWWVPRRNYLFGRLTRGGGWWPDYQLRLLRRGYARYERPVHEIVVLQGEAGYLRSPLIHLNYDSPVEFRAKQRAYAQLEARALREAGVRPRFYTPWTMWAREFWRRFVRLRGYVDGLHGLRLAVWMALAVWETYRLLQQELRSS